MSLICTKDLSIKIANPVDTSRLVYYKLDSYAGSVIDSSQAKNLSGGAVTPTVEAGLIINCYAIAGGTQLIKTRSGDAFFSMANKSVTMRAWMKFEDSMGADEVFCKFHLINNTSTDIFFIDAKRGVSGVVFRCFAFTFGIGSVTIVSDDEYPYDQWHEVVGWYNNNTEAGLCVNAGTPKTSSLTGSLSWSGTSLRMTMGHSSMVSPVRMDEMALWKDYVLTPSDISYDYNGGAGRTFPDVP